MRKTWKTWLCSILCLGMILQSGAFKPIISSAAEGTVQESAESNVMYVNGKTVSSGDGSSAENAVKTLDEAYAKLSAEGTMDENIIVICGDTEIDLSENKTYNKAATITGSYGETDYQTKLTGNGNKFLYFKGDTKIENIGFETSTATQIRCEKNKLILAHAGNTPTVVGCDVEVYSGTYTNVYAYPGADKNAVIKVYGGTIQHLAVQSNVEITALSFEINGGKIACVYGGPRNGKSSVSQIAVSVTQNPTFTTELLGKKNLSNEDAVATLNLVGYTGDAEVLLTKAREFDKVIQKEAVTTVYVNGTVETSGDGTSPETAVKTLAEAYNLLDAEKGMDENTIVICGDTSIDLSTQTTFSKPATITGSYGGTDYDPTLTGDGENHLIFNADTKIENLTFTTTRSTQIKSNNCKLILAHEGSTPTAVGSDIEIYGGTYTNVYVCADADGNATAAIHGGTISNFATDASAVLTNLDYLITGGKITNVWGGPRFGTGTIDTVNITLQGNPNITTIEAEHSLSDSTATDSWINFCDYTGGFTFAAKNYDHIGVIAAADSEQASFASLKAAYQACKAGGTIVIRDDLTMDGTGFSIETSAPVTIVGEREDVKITFTQSYFVFQGETVFKDIVLKFSETEANPTILYYVTGKQPELTDAKTEGHYELKELAASKDGVVIDFGEELTKQEVEGYAPITGETALERYQQTVAALPQEVPQVPLFDVSEDQYGTCIYVAVNGSDSTGDGSIDKPYATPQKALEAVAQIPVLDRTKGVVIYFREGSYTITEEVSITSDHCALPGTGTLTLAAYQDEEVSFVGGAALESSDFTLATEDKIGSDVWNRLSDDVKGKVYVADLKAKGINQYFKFKESKEGGIPALTVNGQQMTIARYPDVGEVGFKSVANIGFGGGSSYVMSDLRPLEWENTGRIYVRGSFFAEWWKAVGRITDIDSEKKTITTNGFIGWGNANNGGGMKTGVSNTHYYYNVIEELTIPGEWFLDEDTGYLYVYPASGSFGESDEICLTTTNTNYLLNLTGANDVIISGITFENGNSGVLMQKCQNVVMQKCIVQDMGGYGVKVYDSFKSGVTYSTIRRTDYIAFVSQVPTEDYKDLRISRCFLQNSLVYDIRVTACEVRGVGDIFSHNTVQYTRSMGISVVAVECILERNELTAQSYAQSDAGGFYVSGSSRNVGNLIRNNYIHDSCPPGQSNARGIYMDDIVTGNYASGNIVENMHIGIFVHSGDENVYVDNVMIGCTASAEVSDNCSITDSWCTGRWGYFSDAISWYNNVKDAGVWDARYPAFKENVERIQEAVALWKAGDTEADIVKYTRAATDNTFVNNIIINGSDIDTNTYAKPYSVLEGNQKLTMDDAEEREYIVQSEVYQKLSFDATALAALGDTAKLESGVYLLIPTADQEFTAEKAELKWTKVHGASYYILTIAKDEAFTEDVQVIETAEAEYTVELKGYAQDYYWKVEAVSLAKYNYKQSSESAVGHFVFSKMGALTSTDVINYTAIVDGDMDAAYKESATMKFEQVTDDMEAMGYLTWDENGLYVCVEVNKDGIYTNPLLDAYLDAEDMAHYKEYFTMEDSVKLTVKQGEAKSYDVAVHADSDGYYGYLCTLEDWQEDAQYGVKAMEDGSGYIVEFFVPVAESLQAGDALSLLLEITSVDGTKWDAYLEIADTYGISQSYTDNQAAICQTPATYVNSNAGQSLAYTLVENTWNETENVLYEKPVIDAEMDEAYRFSVKTDLGSNSGDDTELKGSLYILWDENYIYYYADMLTDSVTSNPLMDAYLAAGKVDQWKIYKRFEDCLELNTTTPNYIKHLITVHADGEGYLDSFDGSMEGIYQTRIKEDGSGSVIGYVIEVAVPWHDSSVQAGQSVGVHFMADSIDTTGMSTVDPSKTKWEYYLELAEEYGIEQMYNGKDTIRQTPLYQYRSQINDYSWYTLSGDMYTKAQYKVELNKIAARWPAKAVAQFFFC